MHAMPPPAYDNGDPESQAHPQSISMMQPDYMFAQTQLTLAPSMGRAPYPYTDSFYGGIVAAPYGPMIGQPVHPMTGVQQARMPLPSEMMEEEPVYVNAKQYHGILRRRQSRAKAEQENKLVKNRKPYLHESRHLHALRRARGCGGRFLNTKSKDDEPLKGERRPNSHGQASSSVAGLDSALLDDGGLVSGGMSYPPGLRSEVHGGNPSYDF